MVKQFLIDISRSAVFQPLWAWLHQKCLVGMNFWSGGPISGTGEEYLIKNVLRTKFESIRPVTLFDVGANAGDYSKALSLHIPGARIFAFEPVAGTFDLLQKNTSGNNGIQTFNFGFSVERGSLDIGVAEEKGVLSSLHSVYKDHPAYEVVTCEFRTIDEFCAENNVDHINLLKIDVEGHELFVLRGASEMLKEGKIDLIQFELGENNIVAKTYFKDFWELLSDDFDIYRILPKGLFEISEYLPLIEVFACVNYLAVKKDLKLP